MVSEDRFFVYEISWTRDSSGAATRASSFVAARAPNCGAVVDVVVVVPAAELHAALGDLVAATLTEASASADMRGGLRALARRATQTATSTATSVAATTTPTRALVSRREPLSPSSSFERREVVPLSWLVRTRLMRGGGGNGEGGGGGRGRGGGGRRKSVAGARAGDKRGRGGGGKPLQSEQSVL